MPAANQRPHVVIVGGYLTEPLFYRPMRARLLERGAARVTVAPLHIPDWLAAAFVGFGPSLLRVARAIREARRASDMPLIVVGHSAGGLVARLAMASFPLDGRLGNVAGDVGCLVTLGTPHRGAGESYYSWGGGEPRSDPTVKAVFDVYLWYLRHAHPFQTGLSVLKTVRTQVPSIRDLLPIDDYLMGKEGARALEEDLHLERNLVIDLLSRPAALETLIGRVPVTTIAGSGFATIRPNGSKSPAA